MINTVLQNTTLNNNEILENKNNYIKEYLKCKLSALYFVENYIKIPVPGGLISQKESDIWWATRKYRDLVRLWESSTVQNTLLMSSRQHGKTTTIAQLVLHNLLFYPGLKVEFLTLTKKNAEDVIERMKFMWKHLPKWLQVPFKGRGDYKTYIELENGSRFNTRYITGNISPDQVARGMSVPMLWVDEAAFIPHFEDAWVAAQPAITTARKFALKNGYPSKIIMTTTPNGAGQNFFYQLWSKSWDYEEIFDFEKNKPLDKANEILNSDPDKNNFARIKILWSETGKDEAWFQQQVKELNFNMRKVNQEINLVFLGSATSIFDDEIISAFEIHENKAKLDFGYGNYFKMYSDIVEEFDLDKGDHFTLGVDAAISTTAMADSSAIVLTHTQSGKVIGEWHGKIAVVKRYALMLKTLILRLQEIYGLDEDSLTVVIERNSFGIGIIEELTFDDEIDFNSFLFKFPVRKGSDEKVPGIMTTKDKREKMFDLLLSIVNQNPKLIASPNLQEEIRNLEQKPSGRIEAARGSHDDLVMAYNFTLFVRDYFLKKGIIKVPEDQGKRYIYDPKIIRGSLAATFNSLPSIKEINKKAKEKDTIPVVVEGSMDTKELLKFKKKLMQEQGLDNKLVKQLKNEDEETMMYNIF